MDSASGDGTLSNNFLINVLKHFFSNLRNVKVILGFFLIVFKMSFFLLQQLTCDLPSITCEQGGSKKTLISKIDWPASYSHSNTTYEVTHKISASKMNWKGLLKNLNFH